MLTPRAHHVHTTCTPRAHWRRSWKSWKLCLSNVHVCVCARVRVCVCVCVRVCACRSRVYSKDPNNRPPPNEPPPLPDSTPYASCHRKADRRKLLTALGLQADSRKLSPHIRLPCEDCGPRAFGFKGRDSQWPSKCFEFFKGLLVNQKLGPWSRFWLYRSKHTV